MSVVTGLVLIHSLGEALQWNERPPATIDLINRWLTERQFQPLRDTAHHATGSKHPQALIYTAGYNHFPEDDFAAYVVALDWEKPEAVVLILQPEEGRTRVFRPPHDTLPSPEASSPREHDADASMAAPQSPPVSRL